MYVLGLTTPNPCLPIPCLHGGVCRPVGFSEYVCECGQENGVTYRGKNCNQAVTLCDSSPCTLGQCVPTGNSYRYKVLENHFYFWLEYNFFTVFKIIAYPVLNITVKNEKLLTNQVRFYIFYLKKAACWIYRE